MLRAYQRLFKRYLCVNRGGSTDIGGNHARPRNCALLEGSAGETDHGTSEVREGATTGVGNSEHLTGDENLKRLPKRLALVTRQRLYQSIVRSTRIATISVGEKMACVDATVDLATCPEWLRHPKGCRVDVPWISVDGRQQQNQTHCEVVLGKSWFGRLDTKGECEAVMGCKERYQWGYTPKLQAKCSECEEIGRASCRERV